MLKIKPCKNIIFCLYIILTACSTTTKKPVNKQDPLETLNRGLYKFHTTLDALYINPVVKVYSNVFPNSFKRLVANFFNNISEIPIIVNNLLQAKFTQAADSTARFTLNSTLGIGGLFDVAAIRTNLKFKKTDFGETLHKWGYKKSMYLFLPILGPTTVRDGVGLIGNSFVSAPYYFKPKWRNRYNVAYMIQRKSELSEVQSFLDIAGVDKYILTRDSYLQNRKYVLEGNSLSEDLN